MGSIVLTPANIKSYVLQTLQGLQYLHMNWILHRDLKPNNLLVDSKGCLKLGDFGLAKYFGSPNRIYTHMVVTRWYRAPELLFGAKSYGVGVDVWAVGCILAELLLRVPFLAGETDLDQLGKIFLALGTPSEESWPGLTSLPDYIQFKQHPAPGHLHCGQRRPAGPAGQAGQAVPLAAHRLQRRPAEQIFLWAARPDPGPRPPSPR